MMWPRLELLNDLMSSTASIWITCDDNEHHRLVSILCEIFGDDNYIGTFIWEKSDSPRMDAKMGSARHDYVVAFAKSIDEVIFNRIPTDGGLAEHYDQVEEDGTPFYLKPLRAMGGQGDTREARPNLYFGMEAPNGTVVYPKRSDGTDGAWRWSKEKVEKESSRIEWVEGRTGWMPYFKIIGDKERGRPPETIWFHEDVGSNRTSKNELKQIFPDSDVFPTPKPVKLIERILRIGSGPASVALDSFAGSGTTGHAVLALNAQDDGDRRFIEIELEDYADRWTAERVRRVIKGVPNAKDEALKKGLGGSFTYCELGEPIDLDRFFNGGRDAPAWDQVARYIVFTATGASLETVPEKPDDLWFVGEAGGYRIHLIYRPDRDWMQSDDAALNAELAERIARAAGNKPVLIYAAQKFMSQKALPKGVTFCQLPYAIYRILGDGTDAA
jgi:DNA modification methylase